MNMRALDHRLAALAAQQDDLITRAQVHNLGGTDHAIAVRVDRRRWRMLYPGVYLTRSAPPTWHQLVRGALLAAGDDSVASHRTAAVLWDLDGASTDLVELTTSITKGPKPVDVVLHRTRRWEPELFVVRHGIRTTGLARTLADYAEVVKPLLAERAVEHTLLRGDFTDGGLRREMARLERPRVRGPQVVQKILDERPEGKPARSGFEVMLLDVCRQYGLPMPVRNLTIFDDAGMPVAEIDLAWPDSKFAAEAMGRINHSTNRQRRKDSTKRVLLARLGWAVEDVYWEDVVRHPAALARRLALGIGVPFTG